MRWHFVHADVRRRKLEHAGQPRKELTGFACCHDILQSRSFGVAGANSMRWLASAMPPSPLTINIGAAVRDGKR